MDRVKVSVIITTYNMECFIKNSIESVLSQKTSFPFEIIISDDCSTDQTIKIVEEYKTKFDDKIKIITSKINTGIIENLKRAIRYAKGEYIALLDADDYWITHDKLQKQFNILEGHPDTGFVYTNFQYINETGTLGGAGILKNFLPPCKNDFLPYLMAPYISPSCILFRGDLINLKIFNDYSFNKYSAQEYLLFLDFASKTKGYYLDEITMHYTVRKNSLSRKENYEVKINTTRSSFEAANMFIETHPIPSAIDNKRIFNYNLKILLISWESGNQNIVKNYANRLKLRKFLKYNPKATYIYIASKSKLLYKLFKPWVLRKRPPGK